MLGLQNQTEPGARFAPDQGWMCLMGSEQASTDKWLAEAVGIVMQSLTI